MRSLVSRAPRLLALVLALAVVVAACQAPEDQASPDTDGDADPDTADVGEDSDPAPSERTTLTIAVPSDLGGWDYDFLAFDPVGLAIFKNVYPHLLDYDVTTIDGEEVLDTQNVLPLYAESWEPNDDFTEWTLTLQQGIQFPSGNELTAHDVKWSKDRAFAAQANVAGVYRLIGLTEPEQVEVVDDYTVRFTQAWPSALTDQIQAISLYVFDSELLQEHATDDDPWAQEWTQANPQSGGAYNVASYSPGEEIVLTANPEFPGPAPAVDEVRIVIISSESTRRLQLEAGDVDIAFGLSSTDIEDLRDVDGIRVVSTPSNEFVFVPMSVITEPFDDPLVRQAMAHAVPYDQIINDIYQGDARPSASLVPLDMPGHQPNGYPYDFDLDRARDLLAEAGHADGFSTELVIETNNPIHERIAVLLQSTFREIGVELEIRTLDPGSLFERRGAQDIPLQIAEGQMWVDDVEYLLATALAEGGFLNYANFNHPRANEIFTELNTTVDEGERMALAEELQDILAEEVPWLVIGQPNFNLPMRDHVAGWVQPHDDLFRLRYLEVNR